MPKNYYEGTPRDPNIRKNIESAFKSNSAPESQADAKARQSLEQSYKGNSVSKPNPINSDRGSFKENPKSAAQPKGFEDFAQKAKTAAREAFNQRSQASNPTGAGRTGTSGGVRPNPSNPRGSGGGWSGRLGGFVEGVKGSFQNPTSLKIPKNILGLEKTPKPVASGAKGLIAGTAISHLFNQYISPAIVPPTAKFLSPYLLTPTIYENKLLGTINDFEFAVATAAVREGKIRNVSEFEALITKLRTARKAANKGKKKTVSATILGGQEYGVLYNVHLQNKYNNNNIVEDYYKQAYGKIIGVELVIDIIEETPTSFQHRYNYLLVSENAAGERSSIFLLGSSYTNFDTIKPLAEILGISRVDGQPDTSISSGISQVPIAPNAVRQPIAQPTPRPIEKPEINKAKPSTIVIPAGVPIDITSPGTATRITPPIGSPTEVKIPHARTVPPASDGSPQVPPLQIVNPNSPTITLETPGEAKDPVTINIPGFAPITLNPGSSQPQGATSTITAPRTFTPTPVTAPVTTPTTTPTTTPSTTPTTTPTTQPKTTTPQIPELPDLTTTAAILAGLTPILRQIVNNTSPEAIATGAATGTCRTTQPGGCTSNLINNATNNINQNTNNALQGLDALAQAEQLRLLKVLDGKLGAQIPNGGIGGFLQRAFQFTRLDKIINALTLIAVLHNAAMLSRSLASTLGDVTSQALTLIGIKDENGVGIDVNKEISKSVNSLIEGIVGKEAWEGTKTAWNKANTIISSASQIVYTVRSIADSAREVSEWIANNTGKIGNALKRFRVVGENAYPHMSENVTHQNAWMLKVQRYREGVDSLDDAASSLQGVLGEVQNIQQEFGELQEQKQRFDKAIKDAQPKSTPDNTPVKTARETALAASKAPSNAATVFRGEGETPNA